MPRDESGAATSDDDDGDGRDDDASPARGGRGAAFAAAPRGIGQTCMREWEAVLLGAVPVLERFPAHGDLYGTAPRARSTPRLD